MSKAASTTVEK